MTPAERKILFAFMLLVTNFILWQTIRYRIGPNGSKHHPLRIAENLDDQCDSVVALIAKEPK